MGVLTQCTCGHDLTEHGEDGPMACLAEDCGCTDFRMGAYVGPASDTEEELYE